MTGQAAHIGDQVTMRKAHPCGSFDWTVVRTGADIGIKCNKCGRRVLIERLEFFRRLKSIRLGDEANVVDDKTSEQVSE